MPGSAESGALLVIGATGELGSATIRSACGERGWPGDVYGTYRSAPPSTALRDATHGAEWLHLDCSEHKEVRALLAGPRRISAVVYCAVPKHRGANDAGSDAVRHGIVTDVLACAEAAALCDARFVAISTDLVYDGTLPAGRKYAVTHAVSPSTAYGRYKAEMEARLADISGNIAVARSSLILSPGGKAINFVLDAVRGKHGKIELFEDELRCMSFADDLGEALVELATPACKHRGIIHIVADEVANRWKLAQLLANKHGEQDKLGVFACSGLSKNSGLNRPLNCALDSTLTRQVLKTKIRGVSERLA